ncbi:MAG: Gfo/Idh/MocA family oxidoreductase [Phycisphaeraceae bacterium]
MSQQLTRWGILGTGRIAREFAQGLTSVPDAKLVAVGSRTQSSADAFADHFQVPNRHATYEALAADHEVDAIYISTPHPMHCENTLLCLAAGKHVLCEKPFAINADQAQTMIDAARRHKLFLMEAMWSRFLPSTRAMLEVISSGQIGEARLLQADFGFHAEFNPAGRLFNPALGGGALLDVGVYPISLASMIFGSPDRATGDAHIGISGVDEQSAVVLHHAGGQLAVLHAAISLETAQEAVLYGSEGHIYMQPPWWKCPKVSVVRPGRSEEIIEIPIAGNGYNYQAIEVGRCLREGLVESPIMPLDETLSIMKTMDGLRKQWGLKYPME